MAEPFLSEIRIMSFVFRAEGLGAVQRPAAADQPEPGAVLAARAPPSAATGASTSRCPTCGARVPIHVGSGHTLGERGGEQAHTLSIAELPTHTHVAQRHRAPQATTARSRDQRRCLAQSHGSNALSDRRRNLSRHGAERDHEHRRQPGAPQHAAVPDAELLHRPAGHLPVADLEESEPWHNPMSARSACSPATSRPPAGCSARGSSCRSPSTRRSST